MSDPSLYREIEIRGEILPWHLDAHTVYETHEGARLLGSRCVCSEAIVQAIDDAQANGVRALLVRLDSNGGHAQAGFAVYERLRRFSRDGGSVVVFIEHTAGSVATIVGVAGDMVVMSPEARGYVCHGARTGDGRSPHEVNAALIDVLAARTLSNRRSLENAHRDPFVHVEVRPVDALELGWADRLGSLDEARRLAGRIARGHRPSTVRSRALAGQPEPDVRLPASSATAMLTNPRLGLNGVVVRIDSIKRNEDFSLRIEATELVQGAGYAVPLNLASSDGPTTFLRGDPVKARSHSLAMLNWTARTIPAGDWRGIAWSGSVFCAVGSSSACATSPDGVAWTGRTIPTGSWSAVEWNGSVFCAIGVQTSAPFGPVCATSPDGVTWTSRTIPGAYPYTGLAWNGSVFCAVGSGGASVCATSADGVTWTSQTIVPLGSGSWRAVAAHAGSAFCAVGTMSGAPKAAVSSNNGVTWTTYDMPSGHSFGAIGSSGGVLAAVGNKPGGTFGYAACATSIDGTSWTSRTVENTPKDGGVLRCVAWTGEVFVALDDPLGSATNGRAFVSREGVIWDLTATGMPHLAYSAIAWSGSTMVALAYTSGCATSLSV